MSGFFYSKMTDDEWDDMSEPNEPFETIWFEGRTYFLRHQKYHAVDGEGTEEDGETFLCFGVRDDDMCSGWRTMDANVVHDLLFKQLMIEKRGTEYHEVYVASDVAEYCSIVYRGHKYNFFWVFLQ